MRLSDEEKRALENAVPALMRDARHGDANTVGLLLRRLAATGSVVDEGLVEKACIAAYNECDMGLFPSEAVDPTGDRRFVRAALTAALERKDHE